MKYERLNNHIYVLVNLLTAELCKQRAKPTFSHPKQTNFPLSTHTNYNSFYKWTKLLTLEITIFGLKKVAAAQYKKFCPERLNWPGRLAGISEGAG